MHKYFQLSRQVVEAAKVDEDVWTSDWSWWGRRHSQLVYRDGHRPTPAWISV